MIDINLNNKILQTGPNILIEDEMHESYYEVSKINPREETFNYLVKKYGQCSLWTKLRKLHNICSQHTSKTFYDRSHIIAEYNTGEEGMTIIKRCF